MSQKSVIEFKKWGIFLKVMPWAVLFFIAKYLFHQMQWEITEFDSQISSLLAAVTFILAFLLSGTLNDYHISSDMPTQIVGVIESIHDTNLLIAYGHKEYKAIALTEGLAEIIKELLLALKENKSLEKVETKIKNLNQLFSPLAKYCEAPLLARLQNEQAKMRLLIMQIQGIRDTDFLNPAYILLHLLLIASSVALLTTYTPNFMANLIVSTFLFIAFLYLLLLIYDLDNPFQYQDRSVVEVDLSFLEHTYLNLVKQTKEDNLEIKES
jgi:hypothetical protein